MGKIITTGFVMLYALQTAVASDQTTTERSLFATETSTRRPEPRPATSSRLSDHSFRSITSSASPRITAEDDYICPTSKRKPCVVQKSTSTYVPKDFASLTEDQKVAANRIHSNRTPVIQGRSKAKQELCRRLR